MIFITNNILFFSLLLPSYVLREYAWNIFNF